MGTRARVTTVAGAATLLCAASVFGAASAMAAPAPLQSAAAESLVGGCGETVRGAPGQQVGVRVAGLSVIHLGQVPTSGSTTFDATPMVRDLLGPIAPACRLTAVALPGLGSIGDAVAPVLGAAQGAVGSLGAAPQQPAPAPGAPPPAPGTPPPAAALPQPAAPVFGPALPQFTPFSVGLFHSAVPNYNYLSMLVGRPGSYGQLQTGLLNTNLFGTAGSGSLAAAPDPAANDVAAAGQASALPASGAERIALPVLVAVLMLATVAAALIRSWVVVTRR